MRNLIIFVITFVIGLAIGLGFSLTNQQSQPEAIDAEYEDVLALSGTAKREVLALARLLRSRPELAIDFTHLESPQFCLNTGAHMLHLTADPEGKIPLAFLHPAEPLVAAGLDVSKLPIEPEGAMELKPGTWYYYPADGRIEPLHGKPLGVPMLIWTSSSDLKPVTWP